MLEADVHQTEGFLAHHRFEVVRETQLSKAPFDDDFPEARDADENLVGGIGDFATGAWRQMRGVLAPREELVGIEQEAH
jgi:hypothetical protein